MKTEYELTMKTTILKIVVLAMTGSLFCWAMMFGSSLKEARHKREELDSLKRVKLELEIKILKHEN